VYNTGSHAELGNLKNIIKNRKINLLLFYLCNLQCCNAIVEKNIDKTKKQIVEIIALANKINIKVIFGGEGLKLLNGVKNQISSSFLTYNDLSKII
jgi:phosphoribosylamine-glycine ligase